MAAPKTRFMVAAAVGTDFFPKRASPTFTHSPARKLQDLPFGALPSWKCRGVTVDTRSAGDFALPETHVGLDVVHSGRARCPTVAQRPAFRVRGSERLERCVGGAGPPR